MRSFTEWTKIAEITAAAPAAEAPGGLNVDDISQISNMIKQRIHKVFDAFSNYPHLTLKVKRQILATVAQELELGRTDMLKAAQMQAQATRVPSA